MLQNATYINTLYFQYSASKPLFYDLRHCTPLLIHMSIVAKNVAKISNVFVSSRFVSNYNYILSSYYRQLLQSTSASRNLFLHKSSSTVADANDGLKFEITKDGKRLSGTIFQCDS